MKKFLLLLLMAAPVQAEQVYQTPATATAGGQPINAEVAFTIGVDSLYVAITNFQTPKSDIQTINGITFTLDTGSVTGSTQSASWITIDGGNASPAAPVAWFLEQGPGLTTIGNAKGSGTIIGPGPYNANSSIDGSGRTFAQGELDFTLTTTGNPTAVFSPVLSFGTQAGTNVALDPLATLDAVPVPEPSSLILAATGLLAIVIKRLI